MSLGNIRHSPKITYEPNTILGVSNNKLIEHFGGEEERGRKKAINKKISNDYITTKDMIMVKYQSDAPVVGRILNEYLFPSRQHNGVC